MTARGAPVMLRLDDGGFVRVPAAAVHPVVLDLAGWPRFWPATTVEERGGDRFAVGAGRGRRRLRFTVAVGSRRRDAGFMMVLGGDLEGTWEVWLEPGWGGTVVHHVVTTRARRPRAARAFRPWLRRGLWGLKDHLERAAQRDLAAGA